jgi:hypothetical protein
VQVVTTGHAIYTLTVSDFGQFFRILGPIPKSLSVSFFTGSITVLAGKFYDDLIYFSHPLVCIPSAGILLLPNLRLYQETAYPHPFLVHVVRALFRDHGHFCHCVAHDLNFRVRRAVGVAFDNRLVCQRCK